MLANLLNKLIVVFDRPSVLVFLNNTTLKGGLITDILNIPNLMKSLCGRIASTPILLCLRERWIEIPFLAYICRCNGLESLLAPE